MLLISSLLVPISMGSELEMKRAFLPLYASNAVVSEGEEPLHAKPRAISFLSRGAEPETTLAILREPFVPHHDGTWHEKVDDTNLITMCNIVVIHSPKKLPNGGFEHGFILDCSKFKLPENVRLTRVQVLELVKQAITRNFGKADVAIKMGEEDAGEKRE